MVFSTQPKQRRRLYDASRRCRSYVAAVRRARRLDEQHMHLFLGDRTVLRAFRYHEHLAGTERDIALAQPDREAAFQHEKEIVRVVVLVPLELALHLHHHQVVAIEHADGARLPVVAEGGELFCEIDRFHNRRSTGLDLSIQIQSAVHALATARVWHPPTVDTKCFFTAGAAKSPDSIKRVAESN